MQVALAFSFWNNSLNVPVLNGQVVQAPAAGTSFLLAGLNGASLKSYLYLSSLLRRSQILKCVSVSQSLQNCSKKWACESLDSMAISRASCNLNLLASTIFWMGSIRSLSLIRLYTQPRDFPRRMAISAG